MALAFVGATKAGLLPITLAATSFTTQTVDSTGAVGAEASKMVKAMIDAMP